MRVGTLIVDIAANIARLTADMASAKGVVTSAMNDITRSVNVAKSALGALGLGLSVGSITAMAFSINKAVAALDDMAEVTGTTVENLSRFQTVAKIGGHDMGLVEDSLVKLTKGLKGTEKETKNAANALGILGIQAKDASGNLRDPGELMREVAPKLNEFKDGAGKTAIALDLFSKSGAKLLPFLKDMAEEGAVNAKVTAAQAAEAEKLEKNLNRLKIAGEDMRREFLMANTGWLVEFTENLVAAQKAGNNLATSLLLAATSGKSLKQLNAEIAEGQAKVDSRGPVLNALSTAYSFTPFGLATTALGVGPTGSQASLSLLYRQREIAQLGEQREKAANDALLFEAEGPPRKELNYKPPAEKKKATGKTAADVLNEAAGVSKDFYKDLALLHAEYARGAIGLEQYKGAVGKLIEKQDFAKELERQHKDEIKKHTEESKAAFEAEQRRGAQMIEFVSDTDAAIKQLEFENSLISLNTVEREKAIAFRKIENDLTKAKKGLSDEEAESLRREADDAKKLLGVLIDTKAAREGAKAAAEASAREWESLWSSVESTGKSAFKSLLTGGKSTFEDIGKTLKSAVIDLLYEITAKKWIISIGTSLSDTLGITTAKTVVDGVSGSSSLTSIGSKALDFLGLGTTTGAVTTSGFGASLAGGAATATTGAGSALATTGGFGLSATGGGIGLTAGALTGAELGVAAGTAATGVAAGGAAAGLAAVPVAGWVALAAIAAYSLMSDDDSKEKKGYGWLSKSNGYYQFANQDIPGADDAANEAIYNKYIEELNDPLKYDQDKLADSLGEKVDSATAQEGVDNLLDLIESAKIDPEAEDEELTAQRLLDIRLMEAQGDEIGALAATRELERDAATETEQATLDLIYAQEDLNAAAKVAAELKELDIRLLEAQGDEIGALAATRELERDAATEAEQATLDLIYAQEDLNTAAEDAAESLADLEDQLASLEDTLASDVAGLSDQLHLDSLTDARDSLAVDESVAPLERFSAARELLDETYASAQDGDLDAVGDFSTVLQSALDVGRDVYASGPEFASLFKEGNRMLNDLISQQKEVQDDILSSVPDAIVEASRDTIAELKRGFASTVDELKSVRAELSKLAA